MTSRRDIDRLRDEIDDLFSELWQVPRFAAGRSGFRPQVDGSHYQRMEIDYGPFRREVALAEDVDPGQGSASYERGLLTVVLPLAERAPRPAKVPIEVRTRP